MPTTTEINNVLKSSLAESIKLATVADDDEDVALMQEDLDVYAGDFGTFIALRIPLDEEVLLQFAELRRLVANLNEDNREANGGENILTVRLPYFDHPNTHERMTFAIPEPAAVVEGGARSASDSTSTGSGGSDDHDRVNGIAAHGGAGGAYHHGDYQELGGGPHHPLHLKVAGVSPDGGCCCDVM